MTPLPRSFYEPSARVVAPKLLGHWLIRQLPSGPCGGPIVETEAYLEGDPASHGFGGERVRNRPMYGSPGYAYVYLIYGFYFCANAVCRPPGCPEAVLIRAIEPAVGLEAMLRNRPVPAHTSLTNGPGKICAALSITRGFDSADLCDAASPLFIARADHVGKFRRQRGPIVICPRIGLTKAADLPLRFCLSGSPFLSRRTGASAAPSTP